MCFWTNPKFFDNINSVDVLLQSSLSFQRCFRCCHSTQYLEVALRSEVVLIYIILCTLLGTNISHRKAFLKMFLLPRWDMLVSWRVFQSDKIWHCTMWHEYEIWIWTNSDTWNLHICICFWIIWIHQYNSKYRYCIQYEQKVSTVPAFAQAVTANQTRF